MIFFWILVDILARVVYVYSVMRTNQTTNSKGKTMNTETLIKKLPVIKTYEFSADCKTAKKVNLDYTEAVFVGHDDGRVHIHCECDCGSELMDYWGEVNDEMWINPKLVAFAEKHNMYWDWENAGVIVLCPE